VTLPNSNTVATSYGGATASYAYDQENRRIKKVEGATTTHYVWEGGQCIAEHNGSTGAVVSERKLPLLANMSKVEFSRQNKPTGD
jgi:hypothetical protein